MGRYAEAAPLYLRAKALWTNTFPENHSHLQTVWSNCRSLMQRASQQGQAATLSPIPPPRPACGSCDINRKKMTVMTKRQKLFLKISLGQV